MFRHFLTTMLIVGIPSMVSASEFDATLSRIIDAEINANLRQAGIESAPQANDYQLLRRIYLDIVGRAPTIAEIKRYINDDSPRKHHRLIDELLAHSEMAVRWRQVFYHWLTEGVTEPQIGADQFTAFLQEHLKRNTPWNTLARSLLLPDIDSELERGASYFLTSRLEGNNRAEQLDNMTTAVAQVFFGVQLQCAKCHDHPFVAEWSQDHYYGLSAFLGRTEVARFANFPVLSERAEGEVKYVTSTAAEEKIAKLLFLDGHVLDEPILSQEDIENDRQSKGNDGRPAVPKFSRRQALADYAFRAENPYFRQSIVNRIWKELMGRGLVEPIDQMYPANPATHPKLLTALADDFAANGFDLRRLMAGILHSDVYLRDSRWHQPGNRPSEVSYAVTTPRPLTGDQLGHSLASATGYLDILHEKYDREKGRLQQRVITPEMTRTLYEKERVYDPFRAYFTVTAGAPQSSVTEALRMTYGSAVPQFLRPVKRNLIARMTESQDELATFNEVFLSVLCRPPTDDEVKLYQRTFAGENDQSKVAENLIWSLLWTTEFRFTP